MQNGQVIVNRPVVLNDPYPSETSAEPFEAQGKLRRFTAYDTELSLCGRRRTGLSPYATRWEGRNCIKQLPFILHSAFPDP